MVFVVRGPGRPGDGPGGPGTRGRSGLRGHPGGGLVAVLKSSSQEQVSVDAAKASSALLRTVASR